MTSIDISKALELAEGLPATASALERLSLEVGPEAARWAVAQWQLRKKAAAKFSRADEMLFTAEALEQATHEEVAKYHASLFPDGVLVGDLTAGIGSDSLALYGRGPVISFELDQERAGYLRHNLGSCGEVRVEDSLGWLAALVDGYVFADPSRRLEGRRVASPEQFSPDPGVLSELGARQRLCAIKLSPMLSDDYLESLGSRLEFVSFGRECREALVILGKEAGAGRFAVHVETGERRPACSLVGCLDTPDPWVFDCDPAAVRAHALGSFGLAGLADSNGYLTGTEMVVSPWLAAYEVLYSGPGDLKSTRRKVRELGSRTPVVKQRGTKQDLEVLRRALKADGEQELVVILYPVGKSIRHVIARPC